MIIIPNNECKVYMVSKNLGEGECRIKCVFLNKEDAEKCERYLNSINYNSFYYYEVTEIDLLLEFNDDGSLDEGYIL